MNTDHALLSHCVLPKKLWTHICSFLSRSPSFSISLTSRICLTLLLIKLYLRLFYQSLFVFLSPYIIIVLYLSIFLKRSSSHSFSQLFPEHTNIRFFYIDEGFNAFFLNKFPFHGLLRTEIRHKMSAIRVQGKKIQMIIQEIL